MKQAAGKLGVAVVALLLALPVLAQEEEEILSNADIVALSEAGLSASVIIAKISATRADFDTSVTQLVALSQAGVDGAVIEAMVNKGKAPAQQAPAAPVSPAGQEELPPRAAPQPGDTFTRQQTPSRQPGDTFSDVLRSGGQGPEMVVIPAGSFSMGCVSGLDCFDDEKLVRRVTISQPVAVSKYEIMFEDYDQFTYPNKVDDKGWGRGRRPVINVSWNDAKDYVAWLSGQTGQSYRLLSESEWEYAARAGSSTKYSWGNEIGTNLANCDGCGSRWDNQQTAPVGSFGANSFGLHDMHGNVWEWVEDCWNESYAGAPSDGTAWSRGDCSQRVLRGGSWFYIPRSLRSAYRDWSSSGFRDGDLGFRVARTLTP